MKTYTSIFEKHQKGLTFFNKCFVVVSKVLMFYKSVNCAMKKIVIIGFSKDFKLEVAKLKEIIVDEFGVKDIVFDNFSRRIDDILIHAKNQ